MASQLTFLHFLSDDITCTFEAESDGHLITSSSCVSLTVLGSPLVKLSNYTMTLVENPTLNLLCEAEVPDTGHPDWLKGVTFTWSESGTKLVNNAGEL